MPQINLQIQCNSSQCPRRVLGDTGKIYDCKFTWKEKGTRIAKAILEIKNKIETTTQLDFKINFKGTIIKRIWHWQGHKHVDQQDRKKSRNWSIQIYPYSYISTSINLPTHLSMDNLFLIKE